MWPVINNKSDDTEEKKWVTDNSLVLWTEITETVSDNSEQLWWDEFRKIHLWDFNVKLKHILLYLRDWVPFWEDVDKKDLFSSMIEYNSKIRRAIGKADDFKDTENDRKAA